MKRLLLIFFFLLTLSELSAQKVGLVLSGGGAKGLAHIGVIRALEENNIPIDYISGTSMGAIVGGLYAAGFSTDEMEELFKSDQFKFWSTGKIQEEYRYFFQKPEETPSWLSLDLERRENKLKILLPTNLIPEEQMDFAFMELFAATNAVCNYDFDRLFVPFLCIATDVYNNKEVELRTGDLGEAIRASMTFPFYFKPIVIDGVLVFDGGIVNNFPVKNTVEAFQPDIIIGHKVANDLRKPNEDDVMAQLENMIMQKTDYEVPEDKGILLETTFSNVGLLDFNKIDLISQAGYRKAQSVIDSIKSRIPRRVSLEEIRERRKEFNAQKPNLKFQNIQVEGISEHLQRRYIIQSIKRRSNIIGLEELRKEYFKLIADPQLKSLRPVSIYNEESDVFDLHMKARHGKPLEIKFGGNVSTKPINQGFLSLDYRFFKNRAYTLSSNIYFGRFYSSFNTGARIDFPSQLPFYISGNITYNRWDYYSTSNEFFFEDVLPPFMIKDENNVRLEVGFPMGTKGKLMLGSSYSRATDEYNLDDEIRSTENADRTNVDAFAARINFEKNSFNYKQYPTEGISSYLGLTYVDGTEQFRPGILSEGFPRGHYNHRFYLLRGTYDKYIKFNKHFSIGLLGEGVYSNKHVFNNYRATLLSAPAFMPTPYSQTFIVDDFRATKYVASGLKTIINLSDQFHIRAEAYGFLPLKTIDKTEDKRAVYGNPSGESVRFMGTGALVYHSGLGPISLTANYFDKDDKNLYFVLSFGYIIFNKRGY
ncbi:patatin-like phospholipase family protein [Gaoshiqia sp. Z1-71]|uniref:patatin-like phospholipase family protein n=1 Tax=Gaoshiqia hydrogeniformans TaxID=3290090 RepID=UPI003BF8BAF4